MGSETLCTTGTGEAFKVSVAILPPAVTIYKILCPKAGSESTSVADSEAHITEEEIKTTDSTLMIVESGKGEAIAWPFSNANDARSSGK